MRVALIAHNLRVAGGVSVGHNMIAAMMKVAPGNAYLVSVPGGLGYEDVCATLPDSQISVFSRGGYPLSRLWYDHFVLPQRVNAFRADVILGLGNMALPYCHAPQAMLCHNAYYWASRDHLSHLLRGRIEGGKMRVLAQRYKFHRDLKKVGLLFCQTPSACAQISTMYGYLGRTAICPNTISQYVLTNSGASAIPTKMSPWLNKTRLFYLTKYYSHKNIEILVDLFRQHSRDLQNVVVFITIDGEQHPNAATLLQSIQRYGLEKNIVNVGPLRQEELVGYFTHCQALIMPTLIESYSVTYLEAMHFGLPILTSDLDFAHDICGDAALYFDPCDAGSIKDAILKLEMTKDLVEKGKLRLGQISKSWDEIAREVVHQLEELV